MPQRGGGAAGRRGGETALRRGAVILCSHHAADRLHAAVHQRNAWGPFRPSACVPPTHLLGGSVSGDNLGGGLLAQPLGHIAAVVAREHGSSGSGQQSMWMGLGEQWGVSAGKSQALRVAPSSLDRWTAVAAVPLKPHTLLDHPCCASDPKPTGLHTAAAEPHRSFSTSAAARSAAVQGPCAFSPSYRPRLQGAGQGGEAACNGGALMLHCRPLDADRRRQAAQAVACTRHPALAQHPPRLPRLTAPPRR